MMGLMSHILQFRVVREKKRNFQFWLEKLSPHVYMHVAVYLTVFNDAAMSHREEETKGSR